MLDAASSFTSLMQEPKLQDQVLAGLNSFDPEVQRAAVRICFEHFLQRSTIRAGREDRIRQSERLRARRLHGRSRESAIPEAAPGRGGRRRFAGPGLSQPPHRGPGNQEAARVSPRRRYGDGSLLSSDANVSAAALDTLRKVHGVEKRPDFRAAMDKLKNSTNPRLKLIATSVLEGKNLTDALRDVQPGSVLDFRYFVTRVEPILAKPGRDGKACVFCHASHVIFKLEPPNAEGVFSDQDSEQNYKYAMRVVNIAEPDKSLILVKPTRPTDSAGNVGDYLATHNGGQRWHGNESSDQYRTILEWIRGARLQASNVQK